jgi:hypothetical protein
VQKGRGACARHRHGCGGLQRVGHGGLRLRGGGAAASAVPASAWVYGRANLVQMEQGAALVLTEGRDRVEWLCREADVDGGRRRRNGVRGVGAAAVLRSSVPPRKVHRRAMNKDRGSVRHGDHRR